jgi:hypothetical protein
MKLVIVVSFFVAVRALPTNVQLSPVVPINNLQVQLSPVEIVAQYEAALPIMLPKVVPSVTLPRLNSTDDAWTVFWENNGRFFYTGQDESDARAKYYSVADHITKFLVSGNKIIMEGGDGGGNDNDMWLKGLVGFAIYHGALQTPTSSYPYRVVFDGNGNHVLTFTDGVAAGTYYGGLTAQGYSSALVASDGSIINTNKDFFERHIPPTSYGLELSLYHRFRILRWLRFVSAFLSCSTSFKLAGHPSWYEKVRDSMQVRDSIAPKRGRHCCSQAINDGKHNLSIKKHPSRQSTQLIHRSRAGSAALRLYAAQATQHQLKLT